MKKCAHCKQDKPLDGFPRDAQKKDGYAYHCKDCINRKRRERYANDEQHRRCVLDRNLAWAAANSEKVNAQHRAWYAANPERAQVPRRNWKKANPIKVAEHDLRRRARKHGVVIERVELEALLEEHGPICHLCDGEIDLTLSFPDLGSFSWDHVVPLALGGPHAARNLRPAHFICNLRKAASAKQPSRVEYVAH